MEKTFDYVIVGAGSSGCVMANRLSENGKNSVLILEAGGKIEISLFTCLQVIPRLFQQKVI